MKTKTQISDIKKGSWLSRISFMQVVNDGFMNTRVKNEDGFEWEIGNAIIAQECYSTHFDTEQGLSKTELAEKLMSARDAIVMVNFHKQATAKTISERVNDFISSGNLTKAKEFELILKGELRTMIGYVVGTEPVLGRSVLIDLEIAKEITPTKDGAEYDKRLRQVDHRSLNWLIYKNVKYIVK